MGDSFRFSLALVLTLGLGSLTVFGCDDKKDDEDESAMTSPGEAGSSDVPNGCENGDEMAEVGESRACTCDDGTASTQVCLGTGMFDVCQCAGGW